MNISRKKIQLIIKKPEQIKNRILWMYKIGINLPKISLDMYWNVNFFGKYRLVIKENKLNKRSER